jgi:hypothetical protein
MLNSTRGIDEPAMVLTSEDHYELFLRIVRGTFQGKLVLGTTQYVFTPRLFRPYDLLKKMGSPHDDFDKFITKLDSRFVALAKSEMYRTGKGWIDKALSARHVRQLSIDTVQYLIPCFRTETVGIDTTSVDKTRFIGIFVVPDYDTAAILFDKHLGLPKTHNHAEWKWSKLDDQYREAVLKQFNTTLRVCCRAGLVIETDVLSGKAHLKDKLTNLVEGCFSGYEAVEGERRKKLRSLFYSYINNVPVHCDSDFQSVPPQEVVRILVRQLAKTDSGFESFTPVNVPLRSHESIPIQVADILVGAIKELGVQHHSIQPFDNLWFDKRKIRSWKGSFAKAACFVDEGVGGQVQPTV